MNFCLSSSSSSSCSSYSSGNDSVKEDDDELSLSLTLDTANNKNQKKIDNENDPNDINMSPSGNKGGNINELRKYSDGESDSEEDDMIWEDVEIDPSLLEQHESSQLQKSQQMAKKLQELKPLTLEVTVESRETKKHKRRHVKRKTIPVEVLKSLYSTRQSHLICLSLRSILLSKICSDNFLLHLAHSIIPQSVLDKILPNIDDSKKSTICDSRKTIHPTIIQIQTLSKWYFQLFQHINIDDYTFDDSVDEEGHNIDNEIIDLTCSTTDQEDSRTKLVSPSPPVLRRSTRNKKNNSSSTTSSATSVPTQTKRKVRKTKASTKAPKKITQPEKQLKNNIFTRTMNNQSIGVKKESTDKSGEGCGTLSKFRLSMLLHVLGSLESIKQHNKKTSKGISSIDKINKEHFQRQISIRNTITPHEKSQLLLLILRSCCYLHSNTDGEKNNTSPWRVRYVTALDPISIPSSVSSPETSTSNDSDDQALRSLRDDSKTFRKLWYTAARIVKFIHDEIEKEKKKSTALAVNVDVISQKSILPSRINSVSQPYNVLAWIEIRCNSSPLQETQSIQKSKSSVQWLHIDPHRQWINETLMVETILPEQNNIFNQDSKKNKISKKKTKKGKVVYVLGVEHNDKDRCSLVDITPRYSNSWIQTLKLRNIIFHKLMKRKVSSLDDDEWWNETLDEFNSFFSDRDFNSSTNSSSSLVDLSQSTLRKRKSSLVVNMDHDKGDHNQSHKRSRRSKEDESLSISLSSHKVLGVTNDKEVIQSSDLNNDDSDHDEKEELNKLKKKNEPFPTNKQAFKNHPIYALPSCLKNDEVMIPSQFLPSDKKNKILGMFKGEFVYPRDNVSKLWTARKWLYQGKREVINEQLSQPFKTIDLRKEQYEENENNVTTKKRGKRDYYKNTGFKPLDSYLNDSSFSSKTKKNTVTKLYGIWQTKKWSPKFISPEDKLPINQFGNIELALLNPGLFHFDIDSAFEEQYYELSNSNKKRTRKSALVRNEKQMARRKKYNTKKLGQTRVLMKIAKEKKIEFAPCLTGFESNNNKSDPSFYIPGGRTSNSAWTPKIRGIVIHEHNKDTISSEFEDWKNDLLEEENEKRRSRIYRQWRKLIKGMLTKDRLDREYGDEE